MDKSGRIVIPCEFDEAESFYRGFARVVKSQANADGSHISKFGVIDKSGKIVQDWRDTPYPLPGIEKAPASFVQSSCQSIVLPATVDKERVWDGCLELCKRIFGTKSAQHAKKSNSCNSLAIYNSTGRYRADYSVWIRLNRTETNIFVDVESTILLDNGHSIKGGDSNVLRFVNNWISDLIRKSGSAPATGHGDKQ